MDEDKLRAIVRAELKDSTAYIGGNLSLERAKALDLYLQEPLGNEVEGQSEYVTSDVLDVVEWALPSLLKIFTQSPRAAKVEPSGPDDEEVAEQATDYINHVFYRQNDGFMVFYTWFKDALIQKNGFVKRWWHVAPEVTFTNHSGLTIDELTELLEPEDDKETVEIIEQSERVEMMEPEQAVPGMPPSMPPAAGTMGEGFEMSAEMPPGAGLAMSPEIMSGLPTKPVPVTVYDVRIKRRRDVGRIRIENVPPEELLISRRARSIKDAIMVAHRVVKTVQEWVDEFGFDRDELIKVAGSSRSEFDYERSRRRQNFDRLGTSTTEGASEDLREVWLNHVFMRIDGDGDGFAEWRAIWCDDSVSQLFANDTADEHPFENITPVPMPHQLFGLGMADLVGDLQLLHSVLMRQGLNNIYMMNNARNFVSENVNLSDYLTNRPGGYVRVKSNGMPVAAHSSPVVTQPVAEFVLPMLERAETAKEMRSGVVRFQSVDADAIHDTAEGVAKIMGTANQRLELIARIFAMTGVRDLFRGIYRLIVQHQDKQDTVRLRGKWVDIDPRHWNAEMDVTVEVGLGYDDRSQQSQMRMGLLGIQKEVLALQGGAAGPLVTFKNLHKGLTKTAEAMGEQTPEDWFSDPADPEVIAQMQAQPPKVDPAIEQAKLVVQGELQKAQLQVAAKEKEAVIDAQIETQKTAAKKDETVADVMFEKWKVEQQLAFERWKVERELASRETIARESAAAARETKAMDVGSRERTAGMNNATKERTAAAKGSGAGAGT